LKAVTFPPTISAPSAQLRSGGKIRGLPLLSHLPLTLNGLRERLDLSNGLTGQGSKSLRELGAVRVVTVPNKRRTHFETVAELRNLARSFLCQQVSTHLSESEI
jgi:DNA-binding transcriptional regulator GbsR (MarR family)